MITKTFLMSRTGRLMEKKKATFEIILDIYDSLLGDLQQSLKIEKRA